MAALKSFKRDHYFKVLLFILLLSNLILFGIQYQFNSKENIRNIAQKKEFHLVPLENIQKMTYLSIINRSGQIELLKESPSLFPWMITSHGNILADTSRVKELMNLLSALKVKRQIKADLISIKNYSLDSPYLSISYLIPGLPITTMKIGLINDYKKVAYIKYDQSEHIYEASYKSLVEFDKKVSSFANVNPFKFSYENISSIHLQKGGNRILLLKKGESGWTLSSKKYTSSNGKKIKRWLDSLKEQKSIYILDKIGPKVAKLIDKHKKPWREYKMIFSNKLGNVFEFNIYPISNLDMIGNKKRVHYVLFDKFRSHPIVLDPKIKKLLSIKERSFR